MLDLSTCFNDDGSEKPDSKHIDLSNRPVPKDVVITLDSGFDVQCEVKYDGHWEPDKRYRRFVIVAEIDWLKHKVARITVGENPIDVILVVGFPDSLDSELRDELMRWMGTVPTLIKKTV